MKLPQILSKLWYLWCVFVSEASIFIACTVAFFLTLCSDTTGYEAWKNAVLKLARNLIIQDEKEGEEVTDGREI